MKIATIDRNNALFIYIFDKDGKVFMTKNFGVSWETTYSKEDYNLEQLYVSPHNSNLLYAKVRGYGSPFPCLIVSFDRGLTWSDNFHCVGQSHDYSDFNLGFDYDDSLKLYSSTFTGHHYFFEISYDKGYTFNRVIEDHGIGAEILGFSFLNKILVLPSIESSSDDGKTWSSARNGIPENTNSLAVTYYYNKQMNVILYGFVRETNFLDNKFINHGIYTSIDCGENWEKLIDSPPVEISSEYYSKYFFYDNLTGSLYLGTKTGIWVFNITVNIDEEINTPPRLELHQNYPNPFNPTTTIKYSVPPLLGGAGGGLVTLKIFDTLGREIQTLVNKTQQPGTYKVEFNGVGLPSGIYVYKLTAGAKSLSRKMLLLK